MIQYIRPFCFLVLFFSAFSAFAAGAKTDSLVNVISKEPNDTVRFRMLVGYIDQLVEGTIMCTIQHPVLAQLKKMESDARRLQSRYWEARAHQAEADFYFLAMQHKESFLHVKLAKEEWEKTGNSKGMAEVLFLEGKLLIGQGGENRTIQYWDQAISICQKNGFGELQAIITGYVASYWLARNEYKKAAVLLEEWLKIPNTSKQLKAYYLANLGSAYINLRDYKKADFYMDSAISLAKRENFKEMEGSLIFNKACQAFDQGQLQKSEKLALQSLPMVLEVGHLNYIADSYGLLMDIYKAMKNYEKALYYSEIYFKINDSINKQEKQIDYKNLDRKYQSNLKSQKIKEQEAKILEERKQRKYYGLGVVITLLFTALGGTLFYVNRKRKELKLNQSISESEMKALRAQMNPHFMFNSLNAIQQMVMNNENENAFQYLDTYSKLTRQILENSEKKWITVKDEMKFLELYLEIESLRFEHAFRYKIEASDEVMPNSDRIPAMVVQPIVENAIKHGLLRKDGDKNLLIRFDRKDDKSPLEVVVEDNGLGRAATLPEKKESDHHSMSLGITENRLQLLDATGGSRMEVEDLHSPDGTAAGTRVHIYISQNA